MMEYNLAKYDTYKDSGVEWLWELPKHWVISRIKEKGSVKARVGWKALKASEYVDDGFAFLSTPNIKNKEIDFDNVNYITYDRYRESPEIMLKEDDILLVKDGSTLGIVNIVTYLPKETTINSSIGVLRFDKTVFNKYLFYQIESKYIQDKIQLKKSGMGVPHLFQQDINNFIIVIPPLLEQKAIANYLDIKTAQIDRKIEILTQKATKYGKLKQSLINETVTRGLDKNVVMKNSGVEWIGNVPEHWEVKRLKEVGFLYSGLSGKKGDDFTDKHEFSSNFIPFVNIANNQYISTTDMKKVIIYPNEKQNKVKRNDLFFLMSSENHEDIGKSALLKVNIVNTYLNSFCKGFRFTRKDILPNFINYLLGSEKYRNSISIEGKGFTRINLKIEKINDLLLTIPPYDEQRDMVDYLDTKTMHIDQVIEAINSQIEKLKELRKTLINDVVTGKIKV